MKLINQYVEEKVIKINQINLILNNTRLEADWIGYLDGPTRHGQSQYSPNTLLIFIMM